MDQNNTNGARRSRGRARGNADKMALAPPSSQQQIPSTNGQKPQLLGSSSAKPKIPSKGQQVSTQPTQAPSNQDVEKMRRDLRTLKIENVPVQSGRALMRGSGQIEPVEHYRLPRPISSQGDTGKSGKLGKPLKVVANYFPITQYTNWSLYQYRVDFNPPQDRFGIQRGLLAAHKEKLGAYLFDGTMLFSSTRYQPEKIKLISKRSFDDSIVTITIYFTSILEKNDHKYIQVFNILLRSCLRFLDLQLVGRNYYDPAAKIKIPKHKLEIWPGYETTINLFENGLLLRADIRTKIMRQDTVLDFFKECFSNKDNKETCMNNFKMGIIGSIVLTGYNNTTYRVDDVICDQGVNSTFKKKDGSSMTYREYYKQRWNLEIRGGNQPLLVSKQKKSFKEDDELVYLIPEFCNMTGFTDNMRSNFTLMKDVSEHTNVAPKERTKKLMDFINRFLDQPNSAAHLQKWNLKVEKGLVEINSRVLPLETLCSNNQQYEGSANADWTHQMYKHKMYTCVVLKVWVVLTPERNFKEVNEFLKNIKRAADGMSFYLPKPIIETISDTRPMGYVTKLEQIVSTNNPSFIMVITETQRSDLYGVIKRKLCVDRAVPSQVVTLKNVKRMNLSVCTKIAVQINCKLGGAPWKVNIPLKGMMIVGFDVCHDKQRGKQSYGGFVSTMDDSHTSYFSCVHPHPNGQDISGFFGNCMIQALYKYKMKNKVFPTHIVVYRDGVGEGQLSYVHKTEVSEVKRSCQSILKDDFSMAFIVVTKRINTKLFVKGQNGTMMNPPPGTVVDTVITDPSMYDFFLVSQHTNVGTVTPTHYMVIEDNLKNWNPDRMQKLTYKLCHMYYNWSGTVRVPAPCQFAHKLAYLTSTSLQTPPNEGLDELLYFL